jgi:hypothetical protein
MVVVGALSMFRNSRTGSLNVNRFLKSRTGRGMDACVTTKLGPSLAAGSQRDGVPLKGAFVLRDGGRERLEAGGVRPSGSGVRPRSTPTRHENQFTSKAHRRGDSRLTSSADVGNPQKSLMFAPQPIREFGNNDTRSLWASIRQPSRIAILKRHHRSARRRDGSGSCGREQEASRRPRRRNLGHWDPMPSGTRE